MCAIAGILKFDHRERAERSRLERMSMVQQHRGPDGSGMWLDGPVGLAHRRPGHHRCRRRTSADDQRKRQSVDRLQR